MFIAFVLITFVVLAIVHWWPDSPQASPDSSIVHHGDVTVVSPATRVFRRESDWVDFHRVMLEAYENHPAHIVVDLSEAAPGMDKHPYGIMIEAIMHCQKGDLESLAVVRPPGKTQQGFFYRGFLDLVDKFQEQVFMTDTLDEALARVHG